MKNKACHAASKASAFTVRPKQGHTFIPHGKTKVVIGSLPERPHTQACWLETTGTGRLNSVKTVTHLMSVLIPCRVFVYCFSFNQSSICQSGSERHQAGFKHRDVVLSLLAGLGIPVPREILETPAIFSSVISPAAGGGTRARRVAAGPGGFAQLQSCSPAGTGCSTATELLVLQQQRGSGCSSGMQKQRDSEDRDCSQCHRKQVFVLL